MGTPIPDPPIVPPVVPGVDCSVCWGVGKEFGVGDTPESINVTFSGINKTPVWIPASGEPLEGTFTLDQVVGLPCRFNTTVGGFFMQVTFESVYTVVFAYDALITPHFFAGDGGLCSLAIYSNLNAQFTGGSAVIVLPEYG